MQYDYDELVTKFTLIFAFNVRISEVDQGYLRFGSQKES